MCTYSIITNHNTIILSILIDGFELENVFNFNRGDVIVFDRSQAHSSINFMKHKVTMKALLSLMTTRTNQ